MMNPIGWFEIYVQDINRAKAFYQGVFSVVFEEVPMQGGDMWMFPMDDQKYGAGGALVRMEGCPSGGNSTLIYFTCLDCANEQSKVVDCGGQVIREKFAIGEYGFISLVTDTEGNTIGLHSLK